MVERNPAISTAQASVAVYLMYHVEQLYQKKF